MFTGLRVAGKLLVHACITGWLLFAALLDRGATRLDVPIWALQDTNALKKLLLSFGAAAALVFLLYAVFGFLTVQTIAAQKHRFSLARRCVALTIVSGVALSAIVSAIAAGPGWHGPILMDMLLPIVACTFGAWIGSNWLAGGRLRKSIGPKIVFFATSCFALSVALILLATETMPLAVEQTKISSADRVRLTYLIRSKSPRAIRDGETTTLTLTEKDVNILLAWGLSLGSKERFASVDLSDALPSLRASIRLPMGKRSPRYLNLAAAGTVGIDNGILTLDMDEFSIGRLDVPRWLLGILSAGLAQKIQLEPLAVPILAQIDSVDMSAGQISATYRRIDMPLGFRDQVFGEIGPTEHIHAALSAQFARMEDLEWLAIDAPSRFSQVLMSAFRLARQRSSEHDPIVENRAAIIGLGIVFGHSVIAEFVGTIPHQDLPAFSSLQIRQLQLHGRSDWSRHFLVSAAVEVVSTESISHDIGLLKEELDSGTAGGSGFSFADLAADRAGTLLGKVATQDRKSARYIQDRIASGFEIDDVFPDASNLPEGISEQQFLSIYGGVEGEIYRSYLHEIDTQLSNLALYVALAADP